MNQLDEALSGLIVETMVNAAEAVVTTSGDLTQVRNLMMRASRAHDVLNQLPGLLLRMFTEADPGMPENERMALLQGASAVVLTLFEYTDIGNPEQLHDD